VFTARCHVADWCNRLAELWRWLPLSSSFTEAVTTIIVRKLSDTTSYVWGRTMGSAASEHMCTANLFLNILQKKKQIFFKILDNWTRILDAWIPDNQ
jgi:hypothetical protein